MEFNVDISKFKDYSKTLKQIKRSALPNAVRGTLNNAVHDVKTSTMPKSAKVAFQKRDKNFFKANSRFEGAKGWDISSMVATVGFTNDKLKGDNNYAVEDLEQQEHGGKIKNKSFIPMRTARTSRSDSKKVKSKLRLANNINQKQITGMSNQIKKRVSGKQRFVRAAIYSVMHGDGLVMGHKTSKGGFTIWSIDSIRFNKKQGIKIKSTPIYNYKRKRSININRPTKFMSKAANLSAKKMNADFVREAERQITKAIAKNK